MRHRLLIAVILLCPVIATAQGRTVVLTFDDLPLARAGSENISAAARLREAQAINRRILAALKRHHAPAIGFVNEEKIVDENHAPQYRSLLREWITDGNELGNHTFSHANLSKVSAADFEKEILDGEASILPLMKQAGKPLRYLRFPYNHAGETAEKHGAIAAFLKEHGYEVAACTIDSSDYVFARTYAAILAKGDRKAAQRLRTAYLDYTATEIEYYTRLHRQLFSHEIPHVMLLHANRLNADTIESILKLFERMGYRFVTLQQAQSDSAYRTSDTFISEYGPMWGYRWARELKIKVDGSQEPEPPEWIAKYKAE